MTANLGPATRGMLAGCSVTAQVGPLFKLNRNFNTVVRPTNGVYIVSLQDGQGIDFTQGFPAAFVIGNTPSEISVELLDSLNLKVRTIDDDGEPIDVDFTLCLWDLGPQ